MPHREARKEAEALRQRLASAEAHGERLQRENQGLRARLGDAEEPMSPARVPALTFAGPALLLDGSHGQSDDPEQTGYADGLVAVQESPSQPPAQGTAPSHAQHSDLDAEEPARLQVNADRDMSRTPVMGHQESALSSGGEETKQD